MRCAQDQEMHRSSGRRGFALQGVAAAKEMGAPPRNSETGSADDDADLSLLKGSESKFGSCGFGGSSSEWLIVFPFLVSWACRLPTRARRAALATRARRAW